eukprot:6173804-Pleurochrysis_carterae.AAC.2
MAHLEQEEGDTMPQPQLCRPAMPLTPEKVIATASVAASDDHSVTAATIASTTAPDLDAALPLPSGPAALCCNSIGPRTTAIDACIRADVAGGSAGKCIPLPFGVLDEAITEGRGDVVGNGEQDSNGAKRPASLAGSGCGGSGVVGDYGTGLVGGGNGVDGGMHGDGGRRNVRGGGGDCDAGDRRACLDERLGGAEGRSRGVGGGGSGGDIGGGDIGGGGGGGGGGDISGGNMGGGGDSGVDGGVGSSGDGNGEPSRCGAKDDSHEGVGALASLLDDLASLLHCSTCLDVFVDPVTVVPCGHSFCADCIDQWLSRSRSVARTRVGAHTGSYTGRYMGRYRGRYTDTCTGTCRDRMRGLHTRVRAQTRTWAVTRFVRGLVGAHRRACARIYTCA